MPSFNKVILIGNMTRDPELKQTPSGANVCTFNIAVNRRPTKDGKQECDFIVCVAWRERAEFVAKYFKKGKPILVCGQMQNRSWKDQNGNDRTGTEVLVDEATFVSSGDGEKRAENARNDVGGYVPDAYASAPTAQEFEPVDDSTLPF